MPRLALKIDPRAEIHDLHRLADRWELLLDRSARPLETARTVLPGLAAVNLLLGYFRNRAQPAVSADGTILVWLDGEIWDRKSAKEYAGVGSGEELTDPEILLRLYLRLGDSFCERLNGQFVAAVYDTVRRRLVVCNDRYAYRSLFWKLDGEAFACGTEIKSVLAAFDGNPEIDPGGVLELFAYSHQFGARTLFRGVRALPPAARLVFERGQVQIEQYWQFSFADQPSRASESELREELATRLRTACARQAGGPGRVGISLSAGLDSRMVIAALSGASEPLACAYTTGYDDSRDVLGGRLLASTYGVRHLHLVPSTGYIGAVGPEVVWRMEGLFPYVEATSLQFHNRLRPELDIVLTGHAGGPLSGQVLTPQPLVDPARFDLAGYLFRRKLQLPVEALQSLFSQKVWADHWATSRSRFYGAVESLGEQRRHIGDANIVMNMRWKQPRLTNHSPQVDRPDFEVRAPLLDYDLVDFFARVPYKYRFAQRLYKGTLAEHFPEAARLPWSKTGRPVPGHPAAILAHFYGRGVSRELVKRVPALRKRQNDHVRTCDVVADELRSDPVMRTGVLEPFVRGDSFPDDILDRDTAMRLIDEHWAGSHNHVGPLASLATVALIYRHFVEYGLQAPAAPRGYPEPMPVMEAA
jgi:asparagine synthase (glutamine-hydrolysing)